MTWNVQGARLGGQRAVLLLALLAAHGLVLLLIQFAPRHKAKAPPQQRGLLTWLLPPPQPEAAPARRKPQQMKPEPPRITVAPLPRALIKPAPAEEAPADAAPVSTSATPATSESSNSTSAAAGAGRAPLNLSLPVRGAPGALASPARSAALDDPRTNTPKLSVSERFAIALGSLECVLDERMLDGSIVRHAGRLKSVAATGSQRDPFGHARGAGGGMDGVSAALGGGTSSGGGSGSGTVAVCVK